MDPGFSGAQGKECAAVALANKTVENSVAWLTQAQNYKAENISLLKKVHNKCIIKGKNQRI